VGAAVEEGRCHLDVAKDRRPCAEAWVRGDADAGALVEFAREGEGPRAAAGAERQVAQFIKDHQFQAAESPGDLPGLALDLFLLQGVDQPDGREEPDFSAMVLDGLNARGGRGVRFAGARTADQHSGPGAIQELNMVQLAHCGLVDLAGHEVEAGHVLAGWESARP